jgi:hypothetical protein
VLSRLLIPFLNHVDAVQQGSIYRMGRFVREVIETIKTDQPVAFLLQITVVAAIAGRIKKALVQAALEIDTVQYE